MTLIRPADETLTEREARYDAAMTLSHEDYADALSKVMAVADAEHNERDAKIARVMALAYAWAPFKDDGHPHWTGCHLVHADCFVYAIRTALRTPQTPQNITEGESRHA